MKPYYEHGGITIYHGDCRDVLPSLDWGAEGGISVAITDPPYGIGLENHGKPEFRTQRSWSIVGDDSPEAVLWMLTYLSGVPLVCFANPAPEMARRMGDTDDNNAYTWDCPERKDR